VIARKNFAEESAPEPSSKSPMQGAAKMFFRAATPLPLLVVVSPVWGWRIVYWVTVMMEAYPVYMSCKA